MILFGGVIFGGVVSTTLTNWVALDVLPETSFAIHNIVVLPNENVFDALFVIVTGSISVAVALPSDMVLLLRDVASNVTFGGGVIFGGVVSTTLTNWVALDVLPETSFAIHNIVVLPNENVFDALFVIVTGSISVAVALPSDIVLLLRDVASNVTFGGGVIFGGVVSTTLTNWVALDVLPETSFAIHNIVVLPNENVFDALFVIVTGSISVTVALPNGTALLLSDVASKVTLAGGVIFGGVVLTISTVCVAFALLPASSV